MVISIDYKVNSERAIQFRRWAIYILKDFLKQVFEIVTSKPMKHDIKPYGLKTYWKNGEYITEQIDDSLEFKLLSELLSRNN